MFGRFELIVLLYFLFSHRPRLHWGVERSFCRVSVAGGSGVSVLDAGVFWKFRSGHAVRKTRRKHQLSLKGTQTVNVFTRGCVQTAARGEFNARLQTCDRVFNFRVLVLLQQQICARLAHSSPVQGNRFLSCRNTFTHERV